MSTLALEVKGLTKAFGGLRAVDNVSFEVPAGGLSALIGPNGSGKTTLFNLITNLYRADAGEVWLFGAAMADAGDWRIAASGVVRTFQTARVFPGMTAFENVLAGAHRHVRAGAWQQMLWLSRAREEERALQAQGGSPSSLPPPAFARAPAAAPPSSWWFRSCLQKPPAAPRPF